MTSMLLSRPSVPVYKQTDFTYDQTMRCVIPGCGRELHQVMRGFRRIPDSLCNDCMKQWADSLDEPWLKYLINQQRVQRQRVSRRAKAGIHVDEVSYDQMVESGVELAWRR